MLRKDEAASSFLQHISFSDLIICFLYALVGGLIVIRELNLESHLSNVFICKQNFIFRICYIEIKLLSKYTSSFVGVTTSYIESFNLLNDIFPFTTVLDADCPILYLTRFSLLPLICLIPFPR
jgi:hypothetical protein